MIGFADALLSGVAGTMPTARQTEFIGHIKSSGQHLLDLIKDLLDLSSLENGVVMCKPERFDALPAVKDVITEVDFAAERASVALSLAAPATSTEVFADKIAFKRMVTNLVQNAVKYSPANGHVSVTISRDTAATQIIIEDDGPGFEADKIEDMRQPFTQADPKADGVGLGLAITDTMIRSHGGELALSNRPEGGACVSLTFPDEAVASAGKSEQTPDIGSGNAPAF